jgi:branched-chain amino acid aminotransferase
MTNEQRIAYFNGAYIRESEVRIPFRDRGFICGDAGYDMARTFNGVPFKLQAHVGRLFRTLRYLDLQIELTPSRVVDACHEVIERNAHFLTPYTDYWVTMRVTRGVPEDQRIPQDPVGPSVLIECSPLPLAARAKYYRDGIDAYVSSIPRVPPQCLSPRAKTHNYLNLLLADREARRTDPEGWGVMLDHRGNVCEGIGNNIFFVTCGVVHTPQERFVLPGISRETVIELCRELDLPLVEGDFDAYDLAGADEAFFTSTSLCLCPVRSVDGRVMREPAIPGPVTRRILDAFAQRVGCDFVRQYLHHLEPAGC